MSEPTPNPEPSTDPVRRKAEAFRAMIKEKAGIDFDYSMFTLLHLDAIFNDMVANNLDNLQKPEFEKHRNDLVLQLGFFIGECMRETFYGQWENDPNLGICLKRIANQDLTAFPLSTAADCVAGEKGKVFAVTQFLCVEVFKKVRERYYPQG
jgi:hypothetical protein